MANYCATFGVVVLTAVSSVAFAQTEPHSTAAAGSRAGAQQAETPPSDIAPSTWARVPRQVERDPFAIATFGIEASLFVPRASLWPFPSSNGEHRRVSTPRLGQQDLYIGALHFFGHADIFVSFPIGSRDASGLDGRTVSLEYAVAAGAKLYPWALRPGSIRPYVSSGLMLRAFEITDSQGSDANVGRLSQAVVPMGAGVAWRTPRG